jgi:hypothetical protein
MSKRVLHSKSHKRQRNPSLINNNKENSPNKKSKNVIFINGLPHDIWNYILLFLSPNEHNIFSLACHRYKNIIKDFYDKNQLISSGNFSNVLSKIKNMSIKNGYLSLFEWLYENYIPYTKNIIKNYKTPSNNNNMEFVFDSEALQNIALHGHLNLLIWLKNKSILTINHNHYEEPSLLIQSAALGGHLHILKWLMSEVYREKNCASKNI